MTTIIKAVDNNSMLKPLKIIWIIAFFFTLTCTVVEVKTSAEQTPYIMMLLAYVL